MPGIERPSVRVDATDDEALDTLTATTTSSLTMGLRVAVIAAVGAGAAKRPAVRRIELELRMRRARLDVVDPGHAFCRHITLADGAAESVAA